MKLFRRLAGLNSLERKLLIHATMTVAAFRLALWLLPGSACFRLAQPGPGSDSFSPACLAWAVRTVSRHIPGATCLTQALALRWLLSRSGHVSVVRIGVAKQQGRFHAHAWVEHAGAPLLSTPAEVAAYAPLAVWESAV